MRRATLAMLLLLGACAPGAPAATPSPSPITGPLPEAVDEAFCRLELALPGAAAAIAPLGEALSAGNFDPELLRREGPKARRAIASVRPFLPTVARWAPSHDLGTTLDSGLARVDSALERLMRDPNDVLAKLDLATGGNDVGRALRDLLPALEAVHPEIRCAERG